jgi:hypothetical protein
LILFFDAAHFSNSVDGKVWAVLAIVLNLPLSIRGSFLNIVPILFWQGHVLESFNDILKHHLKELVEILQHGISIRIGSIDMVLKVFIHCLIGDSPARAKIANSKQFNGKFGCLKCMNSGEKKTRTRIYPYKHDVQLRSSNLYRKQAHEAEILGTPFEGIKGENFLSKFCVFPDSILTDSMHLLGLVKRLLFLMFDSKNSKQSFYIGIR